MTKTTDELSAVEPQPKAGARLSQPQHVRMPARFGSKYPCCLPALLRLGQPCSGLGEFVAADANLDG